MQELVHETAAGTRKRGAGYRVVAPLLRQLGFVGEVVDQEKYLNAIKTLEEYVVEEGHRHLSTLLEDGADYNVVVVPLQYRWKMEELVARLIADVKGWKSYRITKLMKLLIENSKLLEKLGQPLQGLIPLFESEAQVSVEVAEKQGGGVSVGVGEGIDVVGSYSREKEVVVSERSSVGIETARHVVKTVLEMVSKPTILIISEHELEVVGANTILNAVVANPNLVVVTFLPTTPSREFVKLVVSDRTYSFHVMVKYASMKSAVINMYMNAADRLCRRLDFRRKGTRVGIANLIRLLVEMGVLQHVAGTFVYRLANPILVSDAMNRFLAKMFGLLERKPSKILEFYERSNDRIRRAIRSAFYDLAKQLEVEVLDELGVEYINQKTIKTIYSMITMLPSVDCVSTLMDEHTLRSLGYPAYLDKGSEAVEFLRKMGVLNIVAKKHGYVIEPGIERLYRYIKCLLGMDRVSRELKS